MAVWGLPQCKKIDTGPAYASKAFAGFCPIWGTVHVTGIPYNPQGQARVECARHKLKLQLKKQKWGREVSSPTRLLRLALLTLNFVTCNERGQTPMEQHCGQRIPGTSPLVYWKIPEENVWQGPDPFITWGQGYACVFPETAATPFWIPGRCVKQCHGGRPRDTRLPMYDTGSMGSA